jgi:hypothetical protein
MISFKLLFLVELLILSFILGFSLSKFNEEEVKAQAPVVKNSCNLTDISCDLVSN